jgi:hypothetical protein
LPTSHATHFLNVDLELITRGDVSSVLSELGSSVFVLRDSSDHGRRVVWLELAGGDPADANDAVARFVRLVRALSSDARRAWDDSDDRCLNVGIQGGSAPDAAVFPIAAESVAGMAEIGARLAVTVYAGSQT